MKKVRITVLKRTLQQDLIDEYGRENLGKCSRHPEGKPFFTGYEKPICFCDKTWMCISHYVFALAHGAPIEKWLYKNRFKLPRLRFAVATMDYVR